MNILMNIIELLRTGINALFYTSNIELLRNAILENNADKVNSLLTETDVNSKIGGNTPLMYAVHIKRTEKPNIDIIKSLLAHGANTNIQSSVEKTTALILATSAGHPEVVNMLLGSGAKPNIQNKTGRTALQKASLSNNTKIVDILLANGANPNICDDEMRTALHWSSIMCHGDVAEILLNHGADITLIDKKELTVKNCSEAEYNRLERSNKKEDLAKSAKIKKVLDAEYTQYSEPMPLQDCAREAVRLPLESRRIKENKSMESMVDQLPLSRSLNMYVAFPLLPIASSKIGF